MTSGATALVRVDSDGLDGLDAPAFVSSDADTAPTPPLDADGDAEPFTVTEDGCDVTAGSFAPIESGELAESEGWPADEDGSDSGSAHATAGDVESAKPTPRATASAPTRPTYREHSPLAVSRDIRCRPTPD